MEKKQKEKPIGIQNPHKRGEVSPKDKLILKVRMQYNQLSRYPTRSEFIDAKYGTEYNIRKYFGKFSNLLLEINVKDSGKRFEEEEMLIDMNKLRDIMIEFNLDPVRKRGDKSADPINRSIFCNILADKYVFLRGEGNDLLMKTMDSRISVRTPVSKFLGYPGNHAIKYQLDPLRITSLKGYKDYYKKYLVIKAGFNDDSRYIRIEDLKIIRDKAQADMTTLMNKILSE